MRRHLGGVLGAAAVAGILSMAGVASANLVINPIFESSITTDPNAATIENTINTAIQTYESYFATPITVTINFKEDSSISLGQSNTYYDASNTYSQYYNALATHATTVNDATALASLPVPTSANTNNPLTATPFINMTLPLERALGLGGNNGTTPDSTISLNTSIMNLTRTNPNPNKFDLQTTVYHEINEVLGLGSSLDGNTTTPTTSPVNPEDLFRYSAAGTRSYSVSSTAKSYFSINGGVTNLSSFNQNSQGDFGDWAAGANTQVQDAFLLNNTYANPSVSFTALDVLGYTPVVTGAIPEPATLGLLGVGAMCLLARRRRRVA